MSEWPGVFVSSTVYDLIDLRAELEVFLRELGFSPLLSDRPSSDFSVLPTHDSIATCLENVRKSSAFICVLSQRYGPRLKSAGFEDVSATHLEYREARNAGVPIYFYARDRLRAEHGVWRKDKGKTAASYLWVKNSADFGLFELLDEHERLVAGGTGNWIWPFRDSVELRQRIAIDLQAISRKRLLRLWVEQQRVPAVSVANPVYSNDSTPSLRVTIRNLGTVPALGVRVRSSQSDGWMDVGDLPPLGFSAPESSRAEHVAQLTDSATDEYYIAMPADDFKRPHTLLVHYAILTGEVFQTAYTVSRTNEPWMSLQIRRGDTSIVSLEPPDLPPIGQRP